MCGQEGVQVPIPGTGVHGYGYVVVLHAQADDAHDVGVSDASEERGVFHKPSNLFVVTAFFQSCRGFVFCPKKQGHVYG